MKNIENLEIIIKTAELFSKGDRSQREIAEELEISQASVSSYLKTAEKLGIIKLVFSPPPDFELKDAILKKFKLRDAVVVDVGETEDYSFINRQLGMQAALILDKILKDDMTLTIAAGSTLYALAQALPQKLRKINIFPAQKEFLRYLDYITTDAICSILWEKCMYGALVCHLSGLRHDDKISNEDEGLKNDITMARDPDIFISGIGAIVPQKVSYVGRLLRRAKDAGINVGNEENLYEELVKLEVVGDICDIPLGEDGNSIKDENLTTLLGKLNTCTSVKMVFDLELLKELSKRHDKYIIIVGGGWNKVKGLRAALKAGLLNVLITDVVAARGLLEKNE